MAQEKILVVEDSPTDMALMTAPLEKAGYHVITAIDGEEALEKAVREQPGLIVLDIILPKRNGFHETQDIKIIMLTSKTQDSDRFWGLKQGADEYMTKPFDDEELVANVAKLL
jgi:twitching motility two-component system response regulator PilH